MRLREINLGSFNTHLGLSLGGGVAVIISAIGISRELGPWLWGLMALGIVGTSAGLAGMALDGWRALHPKPSSFGPISTHEDVVLLEPLNGAVVGRRVTVRGFAQTFEANVAIEEWVRGTWKLLGLTTAAGWAEPNRLFEFNTTIWLERGQHHIRVGDRRPRDGQWFGVEADITVQ